MTDITKNFLLLLFLSFFLSLVGCATIQPITNMPNATPVSENMLQGPADEDASTEKEPV